jgi:protein gp37
LTLQPQMLTRPLEWKKPQNIFVNSMSDLFHDDVPLEYIQRVFAVMNQADWHQYQVLTKRAARVHELSSHLEWAPHIWMGVSVENEGYLDRIDHLRKTGAHVKFLSLEPLLGPLHKMNLRGIDWAIVGGESGPGARPVDPAWVTDSAINALRPMWRSSLNSGAASRRRKRDALLKAAHGIKCRSLRSKASSRGNPFAIGKDTSRKK